MRFPGLSLLLFLPVSAAGSTEPSFRVLHSDETGVEVEWTMEETRLEAVEGVDRTFHRPAWAGGLHLAEPGAPDLPSVVELVGIPLEGQPRVRVVSVLPPTMPLADMAPAPTPVVRTGQNGEPYGAEERRAVATFPSGPSPESWAEIDGIASVRGHRLARLVIHPWRYDASRRQIEWARYLRVRVEFDAPVASGAPPPDHAEFDRALDRLLLNAPEARRWRRPVSPAALRGPSDSFDSSPNWLKVPISVEGMYRIDYFTFSGIGIDPGSIDPTTIRVFSGTNRQIPDTLSAPPVGFMTECALLDLSPSQDAIFDLEDRLLFYALDADGWASEYDASARRDEHVENQYTDITCYWITWGGDFASPPARMAMRDVTPNGAAYDTTANHRVHFEQNRLPDFHYRDEDGWMWEDLENRGGNRPYFLSIDRVAPSGAGTLVGRILSHGTFGPSRFVELKIGNTVVVDSAWIHSGQSAVIDVTSDPFTGLLREGSNTILVNPRTDTGATDDVYTAWFEIDYERRLEARNGYLKMWAPASAGDWELAGFASGDVHLLDVTDQHAVVRLDGHELVAGSLPHRVRFSDPETTVPHWYVAFTMESVRTIETAEIAEFTGGDGVRSLRRAENGAEYLIIYHPLFRAGADCLKRLREEHVAGTDVMAVSLDDVYDEFSWGMVDAVAIRDFLAFTQIGWTHGSPLHVTLIGDASYDFKGFLAGSPVSYLPTYINRYRTEATSDYPSGETNLLFYSTDDFFGYLDPEDYVGFDQPALDLAIGRYPVSTPEAFDVMLDKLESYLDYDTPGQWQNRVILAADDERVLSGIDPTRHTAQVEELAQTWLPPALDRVKVYLTEYPRDDFGKKPQAQAAFIDEYTRGALMVTYTGHGDQNTLAQEEVFVSQKMSELLNEQRYPVFSTFSCTVSRFDLLSGDSMTELMLKHEDGGTVSTFSSGGLVYPSESSLLNKRWLGEMFGTPYPVHTYSREVHSIGLSAWMAKVIVGAGVNPGRRQNNEKYVLLGDPALTVRFGRYFVEFEPSTVDSQTTDGLLRLVTGDVKDKDGAVLDGFQGTAYVHVTEDADTSGYTYPDNSVIIPYRLDGPTAYRGLVPVVNGHFEARFYVAETARTGNLGRISVFALENGLGRDASGAYDSLHVAPTISAQNTDDREGPVIQIGFEGYESFVDGGLLFTDRPILNIRIEDPSGVNLRPFPQFALLEAEVDDRDQIDLSGDFTYDEGSYTKGRVRRVLPLPPGVHTLDVKALDNVQNSDSARVRFEIVAPGAEFDLDAGTVAAYPNPFQHQVHFVFRMNADADVALKIFTVTGRKVYETRVDTAVAFPGNGSEYAIEWNGRDENGTPLANGTYLYKLEATYRAQSGESEKDQFIGKVVKMN